MQAVGEPAASGLQAFGLSAGALCSRFGSTVARVGLALGAMGLKLV